MFVSFGVRVEQVPLDIIDDFLFFVEGQGGGFEDNRLPMVATSIVSKGESHLHHTHNRKRQKSDLGRIRFPITAGGVVFELRNEHIACWMLILVSEG